MACLDWVSLAAASLAFAVSLARRTSSAFCRALAWISFCRAGSFAMMPIRSEGTGVDSLKVFAKFFSSVSFTSLSALVLLIRTLSAWLRWPAAKFLNDFNRSRSTVAAALGAASPGLGVVPLVLEAGGTAGDRREGAPFSEAFDSADVSPIFDSVAFSGLGCSARDVAGFSVAPATLESVEALIAGKATGVATAGVDFFGGFTLSWDEMMAGSTGAPTTVAFDVGARFAGGVYLFSRPEENAES